MKQTVAAKVPFTLTNVTKCLCPDCPVQAGSQCVKSKKPKTKEVFNSAWLKREDIPGQYCATGEATCKDLNPDQACLCYGCPVYEKYDLTNATPTCYYCQHGSAQ